MRCGRRRAVPTCVMALTEGDNRNALAAQLGKHVFGIPRVIAKINDPLRAEAYRALGLETICRTVILGDALVVAATEGAEATNGFVEPPTAEPLRGAPPPGSLADEEASAALAAERRAVDATIVQPADGAREALAMYVVVIGGGNVGYYLTKELLAAGHEVVMIEKDPARARQIADELGSIVVAERRLRGPLPGGGRHGPRRRGGGGHRRRRGQPRRLPGGEDEVQRAARHRAGQQPEEREALPPAGDRRDGQPDPRHPRRDRARDPGP